MVFRHVCDAQIRRDGLPTRLIPSLDGALYQFDGDKIEALPFSADTLLSASFRFSDDAVVVGGKETVSFGVSSKTGKVRKMSLSQSEEKLSVWRV